MPPRSHRPRLSSGHNIIRVCNQIIALAHNNRLIYTVVSMLSQPVCWRVRSSEKIDMVIPRPTLTSEDSNQHPVVYGTELLVVALSQGPRRESVNEGLNHLGLYHPDLGGLCIGTNVQLLPITVEPHSARTNLAVEFGG